MSHDSAPTSAAPTRAAGPDSASTPERLFIGGGELGALCRAKDWASTPLGPTPRWQTSLKTAVGIALASDFPMIVLWGPALVQIYNDAYRLLMGAKHPGGLGQSNRECWPEVWHINEPIYARAMGGETLSFREARYPLAPHGVVEAYYLTLCYQPIRDDHGAIAGVLVTVFDVTSEVRARAERDGALAAAQAEQLRHLTRSLEQSNRDLDEFAYAASHDLKAPLRNIANLATWIEEDLQAEAPPEVQQHLALLQGRVRRMEALIDGILAYSRAGRHEAASLVDSGALVREIAEIHRMNDDVEVALPPEMPRLVTEVVPLQQVFLNLISNAVKHTRAARQDVRVQIGWRSAGERYEFSVADNGPGVAPEHQGQIWGLFQTLQSRDQVEGNGIGLALVKKIVERRGGRVWVDSTPGAGARFCFTWPEQP